jgi:hypothetical protein
MLQPGTATGWAHCQYRWGMKKAAPEDRFAWKASDVDGEIGETGRTQTGGLTVDWVRIERPDYLLTTFWGTAGLPNDRQLDIEVHQVMSDPELSRRIFDSILKSLSFEDDPLLEAGAEVAATMKSKGLDSYLDDQKQQTYYLIKDSTGQSIGFTMEVLMDSEEEARLNVQGAGYLYMRDRNAMEQEMSFRGSTHLDAFTYRRRIESAEGKSDTEIVLDESGSMSVKKSGQQNEVKEYYPGSAALPDVCFDQIFRQMLDSDKQEIGVDLIEASGDIVPTYISRIKDGNPQAAYVFDLEFMDGRGFSQRVFLDEQRQIFRSLIRQKSLYILERASVQEVLREFPERAGRISQRSQML